MRCIEAASKIAGHWLNAETLCGCVQCKEAREVLRSADETLAKLPKTRDGVRVTLGDGVFFPVAGTCGAVAIEGCVVMADDDCAKWSVQVMMPGRNKSFTTLTYQCVSDCYSTRAAAEKARNP